MSFPTQSRAMRPGTWTAANRVRRDHGRRVALFLSFIGGALFALVLAAPVAASADLIGTTPSGNGILSGGPTEIRLRFSARPDATRSAVAVFTTAHQRVDDGAFRVPADDPTALVVGVRTPAKGVFTVVWSTTALDDGTPAGGSFAFAVDPAQSTPAVVRQPRPRFALPPLARVVPKWLGFVGIMTLVGALGLRFLVWSNLLRRGGTNGSADHSIARAVDRRLALLAGAALVVFIPATLASLVWDVANAAKRPFTASLAVGPIRAFLGTHGAGNLWAVRLLLTAILATAVLPTALAALRPSRRRPSRHASGAMLIGLLFGMGELLVRTLPARVTAGMPRTVFSLLMDWGHLLGASFWIGGVVGLVVTAPLLRATDDVATGMSALIRRFSLVALVCVGVMTLTGLWTAWVHVGGLAPLFSTLYGRTLLVKLVLVAALVGLGAVNILWLLPRVEAIQAASAVRESLARVLLGHFRRVVAIEAVLGMAILLVVPFLSGSARNQAVQLRAADLAQTARASDLPITFTPSALQPGFLTYDISVPMRAGTRVTVGFASPDLGVPETPVVLKEQGDGRFRAAGLYTAMVGRWQARVTVIQPGAQRTVRFDLPIAEKPLVAPPAPPARIRATTWAYGALSVVAVTLALISGTFVSRRLSARARRRALATGPHAAPWLGTLPGEARRTEGMPPHNQRERELAASRETR
jgi:copper transport protein